MFSTLTCDELPHFCIHSLPEQPEQRRDTAGVPDGDLVVVHTFAVHEVPQSAAGVPLDLEDLVVQQVHQVLDSSQSAHL